MYRGNTYNNGYGPDGGSGDWPPQDGYGGDYNQSRQAPPPSDGYGGDYYQSRQASGPPPPSQWQEFPGNGGRGPGAGGPPPVRFPGSEYGGFPGGPPPPGPPPPGHGGGGYNMPGGNYGPPGDNYGPPGNNYGPPGGNYGPPGDNYGPPGSQRGPPPSMPFPGGSFNGPPPPQGGGYGPPGGNYGPPGDNYGPPLGGNYGPPPGGNQGPPRLPQGGYQGQPRPPPGGNQGPSRPPQCGNQGPPRPPQGGPQGPPRNNDYGPPAGGYCAPPSMPMPTGNFRLDDIDFSEANFPQWHKQPTPPPPQAGSGINSQGQLTHGTIPTYSIPQEMQQQASNVALSNCRGRKRALLIGINYFGSKHLLKGCINDVHNMKRFITEHFGFREADMVILTDDQHTNPRRMPTRDNILKAMKWLVSDARMNDSFFFHYSGHGVTNESSQSEEIDGRDEAICPVDFESKGQIVDDIMNEIMVRPLPRGARLTAIFDCCHSATALDLPFQYNHQGKLKNERALSYVGKGLLEVKDMYLQGNLAGALKGLVKSVDMAVTGDEKLSKSRRTKSTLGDVVMFSGCKDSQTSADTKSEDLSFTGAMSYALISSMNARPHQTYVQLLQDIRRRLAEKYEQVPQLSAGRLMDMNTIFIM
ncbi:Ca(2+)-dependent cysteine protease [Coemansia spiralis]|nr:Ca(2+)-dependent cysteine protease [Coemansia spiralis]